MEASRVCPPFYRSVKALSLVLLVATTLIRGYYRRVWMNRMARCSVQRVGIMIEEMM